MSGCKLLGSGILNFGPYATRGPELSPVWRDDRGAYVALVSSKACVEADTIMFERKRVSCCVWGHVTRPCGYAHVTKTAPEVHSHYVISGTSGTMWSLSSIIRDSWTKFGTQIIKKQTTWRNVPKSLIMKVKIAATAIFKFENVAILPDSPFVRLSCFGIV